MSNNLVAREDRRAKVTAIMDKDGYPTEEELLTIASWDIINNPVTELIADILKNLARVF